MYFHSEAMRNKKTEQGNGGWDDDDFEPPATPVGGWGKVSDCGGGGEAGQGQVANVALVDEAGGNPIEGGRGAQARGRGADTEEGGQGGQVGGEMEKGAYQEAWELAKKGKIEEISPRKRVRYYNTWVDVASRYPPDMPALDTLNNLWIVGPPGCGKSRWVHQMYPRCYRMFSTMLWQAYDPNNPDHKVVVLDDLHPDTLQDLPMLKQWADHYPFPAECRGGSMIIRPQKILVTSSYHPRQCFRRPEDLEQILRRFRVVEVADLPPPPPPQMTEEERAAALLLEDVDEADFNPPAQNTGEERRGAFAVPEDAEESEIQDAFDTTTSPPSSV